MTAMKNINVKHVLLGGLIAGIVIFLLTGLINGLLLGEELQNWMNEMKNVFHPQSPTTSMILWAVMCLLYGFVGVWLYASIRPRYGAGPKTALLAGLALCIVSKLSPTLDFIAVGVIPFGILIGQMVCGFVTILLGVLVGARAYKE